MKDNYNDIENKLELLVQTAKGLAKVMGKNTEIVLHDLRKLEIIFIANGYITGRSEGYRLTDTLLLDTIMNSADEDGHAVGYKSRTIEGRALRVSHLVYYDDEKQPYAMICINQDITRIQAFRNELDELIGTTPTKTAAAQNQQDTHYIHQVVENLILSEMERLKPTPINSKETKMEVLKGLENKGVFDVKDSVPQVCEMLAISQATLYNYLRELRQ